MSTILIKNGTLIDGSGSKRYLADILIENEKIKKIGKLDLTADKVIDASGKIVSPGFIDTHSHSDLKVLIEPFVEPKIRQGITTEILGQDGISMTPLPENSSWFSLLDSTIELSFFFIGLYPQYLQMVKLSSFAHPHDSHFHITYISKYLMPK